MNKVGIIGWRGMVGSVLVQRMRDERDFDLIDATFFSTSQAGGKGPEIGKSVGLVKDAKHIVDLAAMDILISCQGGEYTTEIYPQLRAAGWNGYWIDAAKTLRMKDCHQVCDGQRYQELHWRQLYRELHDDGLARLVRARPDRMDDLHDVSGRIGRRRAAYAGVVDAVWAGAWRSGGFAG